MSRGPCARLVSGSRCSKIETATAPDRQPHHFISPGGPQGHAALFHLLVPGGRWATVTVRSVSAAKAASSIFQARTRDPLDPPPSAQILSYTHLTLPTILRV